jgi:hypothetical protein
LILFSLTGNLSPTPISSSVSCPVSQLSGGKSVGLGEQELFVGRFLATSIGPRPDLIE